MPLFVWVVGGLLGLRVATRADEALDGAFPWIVGGAAIAAFLTLRGR